MENIFKSIYRKALKKMRIANVSDFNYIINNDIKVSLNDTKSKIDDTKARVDKIEESLVSKSEIAELKQIIASNEAFLKNDNYRVEKALFDCFKLLEYKFYESNKYTNQLLYNQQIELNKINGYEKKNFNPKVSIIIPAYNAGNYLSQAIDSALQQTYKNIEIIVVNDGSKDNGETEEIAKSYGNRIRYYYKENGGVSSALNYGITKMSGDYFAWLSHDDLYYSTNIEEHINFLKYTRNDNIITFTNFNIIDEQSNLNIEQTVSANIYCFDYKTNQVKPEYSLLQGEINGGSVLIPKEAFSKCGLFDEKLRIAQERDMWFRLMKEYTFYNIPMETTAIRFHGSQVTNTNPDIMNETNQKKLEIIQKLPPETKQKLDHSEHNFYVVMKNYYKMNNLNELANEMNKYIEKDVI